jgi:hypothetical protein
MARVTGAILGNAGLRIVRRPLLGRRLLRERLRMAGTALADHVCVTLAGGRISLDHSRARTRCVDGSFGSYTCISVSEWRDACLSRNEYAALRQSKSRRRRVAQPHVSTWPRWMSTTARGRHRPQRVRCSPPVICGISGWDPRGKKRNPREPAHSRCVLLVIVTQARKVHGLCGWVKIRVRSASGAATAVLTSVDIDHYTEGQSISLI